MANNVLSFLWELICKIIQWTIYLMVGSMIYVMPYIGLFLMLNNHLSVHVTILIIGLVGTVYMISINDLMKDFDKHLLPK